MILPLNMCKRVWDCILSDNIYFLVKFGIAFTNSIKAHILEKKSIEGVGQFFKDIKESSRLDGLILKKRLDVEEIIKMRVK